MSARAARRSQAASYGLPGVPIAEIRTRKWTKQVKTVGHLSIPKWIPDQENPTEALQRGAFKKTKGRKRGAGEVGRMTRSVRQHLDAPLELLNEMPNLRHLSRQSSPARNLPASSTPARTPVPMPMTDATPAPGAAVAAEVPAPAVVATDAAPVKAESAEAGLPLKPEAVSAVVPAPTLSLIPMMPPVSNQMMTDDEQLEMVLDDLPMLDADDSFNLDALDPAFLPHPPPSHLTIPAGSQGAGQTSTTTPSDSSVQPSAENSSGSVSEDDGSANSGSSMPSFSPQSSPMMSRSPSP